MRRLPVWLAGVAGAAIAAAAGSSWAQALTFEVTFDGEINGEAIDASGSGSLERQEIAAFVAIPREDI